MLTLHESSAALRTHAATRAQILRSVVDDGDVLVTTYEAVRIAANHDAKVHARGSASASLLSVTWSYAVLDEGHRVRNPDAAVSAAARSIVATHRLILTGAPIQNRLRELWALFDFVYPGRLGTLNMFEASFAAPIAAGGWTHASALQVATAYQCALVLRDLIGPYLLRRLKSEVNAHLPTKTEQVLFCRLTRPQRDAYLRLLRSDEVAAVLDARAQPFRAIMMLRKICDHPALLANIASSSVIRRSDAALQNKRGGHDVDNLDDDERFGRDGIWSALAVSRSGGGERDTDALRNTGIADALVAGSGKMGVLSEILRLWAAEGHRALLFAQGRQMLDLLEAFVSSRGYSHLRMDGTTPVHDRQALVDKFNGGDTFVFLLTTRVGGVGINLTGADRVIIFSPDWNPSTDVQARERAWRLGQRRHVTVYRFITAGTIEEKIYHRQVFKTALTQRILGSGDAAGGKRLFDFRGLRELFTLGNDSAIGEGRGPKGRSSRGLVTETEMLVPEFAVDLSTRSDDGGTKQSVVGASISGETEAADLQARGIVAAHEFYISDGKEGDTAAIADSDGDGSPSASAAVTGSRHSHRATTDGTTSQTAVLQALYGQGELAGAFSHDGVEGRPAQPLALQRALSRDGATASDAAIIARHASRAAAEALQRIKQPTAPGHGASGVNGAPGFVSKSPPAANIDVDGKENANLARRERRALRRARKAHKAERQGSGSQAVGYVYASSDGTCVGDASSASAGTGLENILTDRAVDADVAADHVHVGQAFAVQCVFHLVPFI